MENKNGRKLQQITTRTPKVRSVQYSSMQPNYLVMFDGIDEQSSIDRSEDMAVT